MSALKSKRFARQFGRACGEFNICNNDGVDCFLIPIDRDIPHQMLVHWIRYKTTKMPNSFRLIAVHFHETDEPDPETAKLLKEFCDKKKTPIVFKKVEKPANRTEYNLLLVKTAIELECNKVAVPDSLDYMDCSILMSMAIDGCFNGPSAVHPVKLSDDAPEVKITRPFCYCTDEEIQKFGAAEGYENKPTGVRVEPEEFMEIAKRGLEMLKGESTNVEMNLFHSQFAIQKKYLLTGDDAAHVNEDEDF